MGWEIVQNIIEDLDVKKEDCNVLNVGCGNSRLSEDMYDNGFKRIMNVDYVNNVIEQMNKRSEKIRPGLEYETMDVTDSSCSNKLSSYNLVVDKVRRLFLDLFLFSSPVSSEASLRPAI